MEENFNQEPKEVEYEKVESTTSSEKKDCFCWLKYLGITLAAFLGAFLAVYFATDVVLHSYFAPQVIPKYVKAADIDDMIKEQEQMMQDFSNFKPFVNPLIMNPVRVETLREGDDYKIVVDLKPFNGNEKNIKVDVNADRVNLSGKSEQDGSKSYKEVSFSQSFSLPHQIDVKDVKKEKHGDKYVIILPIKD